MPMKLWSVRLVENAMRVPSGENFGPLFRPHALMNGASPLSIFVSAAGATTDAR